jgi:hypothetical protein
MWEGAMTDESPKKDMKQNGMNYDKAKADSTKENHMKEIWQCQPVEDIQMSTEQIRKRAGRFEKKIWWRNVREYAGALIASVLFASFFVKSHDVVFRTACGMIVVGMAYAVWQLHRKGASKSAPEEMGSASSVQFYKSQLERQRDLAASVWWWYLAPLVPGLVLFAASSAVSDPRPGRLMGLALFYGFTVGLFIFIWKLNARGARCLQRQIDELDGAENQRS